MGKQTLGSIVKRVQTAMKRHTPEILTGIGIAGMITTTVLAVRATPKALDLIREDKINRGEINRVGEEAPSHIIDGAGHKHQFYEPQTPLERMKLTWRCYIPSAIMGGLSTLCLIGASSANLRRNAALATAYTLSESALREYQEKVVEVIGDKKEQSVRDAIAKDKIDQNPITNREVFITNKGDTCCYDVISGRYFKTDIDKLRKAANELNRRMRDEMYISLNEFYYEIGLNGTKQGDDLGWNIDTGYIDLNFSSQLAEDETPCLVINYQIAPRYDYHR